MHTAFIVVLRCLNLISTLNIIASGLLLRGWDEGYVRDITRVAHPLYNVVDAPLYQADDLFSGEVDHLVQGEVEVAEDELRTHTICVRRGGCVKWGSCVLGDGVCAKEDKR